MLIRRPRTLALLGVLFALAACSDLLKDDTSQPRRVLVQLGNQEFGKPLRAGYPLHVELFVSDNGGLGVGEVAVRWLPGTGTVQADGERTNGNGFLTAVWTPATTAGNQRLLVEIEENGVADTLSVPIVPDSVVGEVTLEAEDDTLVEGESQTVSLTHAADRYGNAYSLAGTATDAPPPFTLTTPDTAVLAVAANGTTALVTGRAPGTGRVIARVGAKADTVTIVVKEFVAPGSFKHLQASANFGCAASLAGAAYCWGGDDSGRLGIGGGGSKSVPTALPALAGMDVTAFGLGELHACAVAAGDVWCWGDNSSGQLGDGTFDAHSTPVKVQRPDGVTFVAVSAGVIHSCALAEDGSAWCWGDNSLGELGTSDGSGAPSATPVQVAVPAGTSFRQLASGAAHNCAVTDADALWCWGYNDFGQVGDGTNTTSIAPVAIAAGTAFRQVGAGYLHSCAVTTAGAVLCWGDNSTGQLGTGSTDPANAPAAVSGSLSAVEVSGGFSHSCALASDGRVFCWGINGSGRLGTGNETDSAVPVAVQSGAIRFQAVDVGYEHSCALGTDNEGYCWGPNSNGQLGIGSDGGASLTPARVVSPVAPAASRAPTVRPSRAAPRGPRPTRLCARVSPAIRGKLNICR
jgi:alpha-tubulin suppressor-like RCC1 family protein